jgi:photosynthetic reaction center cytochrome c subunit
MQIHSRVRGIALAVCVAVLSAGLAVGYGQSGAPQAPPAQAQTPGAADAPKPKVSEEVFKNIQVLKGVPVDQWQATMQYMASSLGVECNFCHVGNEREKDDKKQKLVARKMIEMTRALNKDIPEVEAKVTCFSCHHGAQEPVAMPPVQETDEATRPEGPRGGGPGAAPGAAPATAAPPALPTLDQILDKYVQALGGAEAIQKITSRMASGTAAFGGRQIPYELYAKAPDKRIAVTKQPNGRESFTAFDGKEGWLGATGQAPQVMSASETAAVKLDADFYFATHIKQRLLQMRVGRPEKIGDHDVYMIFGRLQGQPPVRLYFDQQSGLLLRQVRLTTTALGFLPTRIDYDDYRETGGVKIPYRWTVSRPNGRFTIQLEKVEQNVPIDDARFAKPQAPAAPEQKPPAQ